MRYRSKKPLWKHQKYALKRLWRMKSALLWADVGTGKTKIAVDYALARHQQGQVWKVLVVCPLAAVGVWETSFKEHSSELHIVTRNDVDKIDDLMERIHTARQFAGSRRGLAVVVVTYDALVRYVKLLADSYVPDLFIVDESHYAKNYSAVRTKRTLAVAKESAYRVLLSGTPAPNGYIDLYWQVKAVHPSILPPTIKAFRERYCVMGGYMGKEVVGYKNVKELAKRLSKVVIRIPKDVLDLPPVIDQVVPVKLESAARRIYDTLEKDLVVKLRDGHEVQINNHLTLILRLMQVTGGVLEGRRIGTEKLQVLRDLVLSEPGKLVVFCQFVQEITEICEMLRALGVSYDVLRGGKSGAQRDEVIHKFQTQEDPRVLVAQFRAGGIAVTLTAASVAVFYSLSYDAEAYEQARGRIHRGGQTQTCRYIHLLAKGTVDEVIYDALRRKLKTQEVLGHVVRRLTK